MVYRQPNINIMQILKRNTNAIQLMDGLAVETETPTLFSDNATLESIVDAEQKVRGRTLDLSDCQLVNASLTY